MKTLLNIQANIEAADKSKHERIKNSLALFEDHAMVSNRPARDVIQVERANHSYQRGDKVYIFSELANKGDGEGLISRYYDLKTKDTTQADHLLYNTATDYALAVKHLHSIGFHHRDIKPENFLHSTKDGKEYAKLADFGLTEEANKNKVCVVDGSALFAPPEFFTARAIIDNDPNDTNYVYFADKHDAFSLGVTLQRLKHNLKAKEFGQAFLNVWRTKGDLSPVLASQALPIELRDNKGTIKDITVSLISEDQPSYKGIEDADLHGIDLNNLDMNHFDNIIAKLLISDPTKRMSVAEAYEHFANLANISRDFSTLQQ